MSKSGVRFNAQRFKAIREEKKMTYAAISRETGISQATIRHWEQERHIPSMESLVNVMKALGHSPLEVMDTPLESLTLMDLRIMALYSRSEVADELNLTLSGYSGIERGEYPLTPERIEILGRLFGVKSKLIVTAWERAQKE